MSKKQKLKVSFDFQFGIPVSIPATQDAFYRDKFDLAKRKEMTPAVKKFNILVDKAFREEEVVKCQPQFPTKHEIFLFVIQFCVSPKQYYEKDVDNMAKTVMDSLIGKIYKNDNQVETLLISKKIFKKINEPFAYFAFKEVRNGKGDTGILKACGFASAMALFDKYKKRKRSIPELLSVS